MKTIVFAAILVSVGALISGCGQQLTSTPDADPTATQDAGSDGPIDFTYCNKDLPKNQTKFIAVMVSRSGSPDGGPCEIAYSISFGQVIFSCSCGPVVDCQTIGASLAAEAAACLAVDGG